MRPLDGITVLDLTRILSGPYCTMMLADMGARVIKIERPGSGDDTRAWGPPFVGGESSYFLTVNRSKESVAVDFKRPEGRAIVDQLLARADVLVENFRPGTLDAIGLGYTAVAERHPRLIYCSITGYGLTGPQRDRPGYDAIAQAEGGLMSLTGPEGGEPHRLGVAIADMAAGMFAVQGITLAMLALARTGRGQLVDVSLLDSVAALLTYQAGIYFRTGTAPTRTGNRHPSIAPYDTFAAADGTLVLAVGNDGQWRTFCARSGLDDLAADPAFATNAARVEHYDALRPKIASRVARHSRQWWIDLLVAAGVPCAAVKTIDEVMSDPQLLAREMIERVQHPSAGPIDLPGIPVKLSATPGSVSAPPPRLGEHTVSVLEHDLGLSPADIERLSRSAVIEIAPPLSGHTTRR
jgi:crotonobetainyl-CoA:carnitine CoA-transferase CaiB-like acyl-CoA transferase